jgi:sarcosine oxidase
MVRHDAIVLGLGAMGSAACWQLAQRGARVLGFDRYRPPHTLGSTHGDTRVTRLAIGEGEHLTPLALRAHELWREIEKQTGATLLTTNGGLVVSSDSRTSRTHVEGFFANTVAAARRFGIAHELLDASAIRERLPQFRVRDDEVGYFEKDAGFLRPEACVSAQLDLARRHGADIRTNERVLRFEDDADGVRVQTEKGNYRADRLVLSAGPWLPELIGEKYRRLFRTYRQVLYWFDVEGPLAPWLPENFPIFIWELQGTQQGIYGFPALDGERGGVKIATEHFAVTTSPDGAAREVGDSEIASMYATYVAPNFIGLSHKCVKSAVCLYTVTPDFGFVIDWLPGSQRVLVASPCSGHGFKHSATIGEILAELVADGKSRFELAPFGFKRLES